MFKVEALASTLPIFAFVNQMLDENKTKTTMLTFTGCAIHLKSFPRGQLPIKTLFDAVRGKVYLYFSNGCEICTLATYDPFLIVPLLSRIIQANCFKKQLS